MSWNTQGLCNKIDYLSLLAEKLDLQVIAITEHWLNINDSALISLPGFKTASIFSRENRIHGGTAIFIKDDIHFNEISFVKQL